MTETRQMALQLMPCSRQTNFAVIHAHHQLRTFITGCKERCHTLLVWVPQQKHRFLDLPELISPFNSTLWYVVVWLDAGHARVLYKCPAGGQPLQRPIPWQLVAKAPPCVAQKPGHMYLAD